MGTASRESRPHRRPKSANLSGHSTSEAESQESRAQQRAYHPSRETFLQQPSGHPRSPAPDLADQRDSRAVRQVDVARGVEEGEVRAGAFPSPALAWATA
ncbi:hypothetical protein GCM10010449_80980 [Streptomyces rectiviolaceus]|uniref:Uncharacterized protein n=1 Tax=Streptomyces rectiviolaceus TaxID=332591 RepID=A0ABP6NLP7_9ACTN